MWYLFKGKKNSIYHEYVLKMVFTDQENLSFVAAGYVDLPDVFKFGFIMAFINALIWGVVGSFWWKFLGLY